MIDLRDVRVRYSGMPEDALRGITLSLARGSRTAVMGANGSGKSTLAGVIGSLIPPQEGSVSLGGRAGIVLQNPFLQMTSLTVERELAFGLQNQGVPSAEIHRLVERTLVEAELDHLRGRSPSSLSGGEMQRLALAAVLITGPDILVLDEATSLLSPVSRAALLNSVAAEQDRRQLTVVLITQFPREADWCSRLVVLQKGRIACDAGPAQVFSESSSVARLGLPVPSRLLPGVR